MQRGKLILPASHHAVDGTLVCYRIRDEWRSFARACSVRARLGIVAGILAAALALGYAALHSSPPAGWRSISVLRRLERSGIVARADGLDYNLATLRFHLSNLTLATPSGSSTGEPFFTARDVRISLAPATLIGRIVLKNVAIDEPRVALIVTSGGTRNWPGGTSDEPSGSSSLPDILIEHARVTELGVRWRDSQASVDVGVSFELAANGKETSGRIVATRPGRIDWKGHQTTVALDDAFVERQRRRPRRFHPAPAGRHGDRRRRIRELTADPD
jgi:hypothetical protein